MAVVESEGNGRMCTTLPEVLISVMGIEKVIPTWQDLEVYLQLLPRSSTAERMNPYTSLWTGVSDGDGPREFHLVLVDNGRTKVLADEIGRQALNCIRCSACLNVCPVYERTGGHAYGSTYPGPIGAILTPMLTGVENAALAALRVESVRRLLRGLPGEDQHPRGARPPARPRSCARRAARDAEHVAMRALARVFGNRRLYEAAQRAGRVRPVAARAPGHDLTAARAAGGLDGRPRPQARPRAELSRLVARARGPARSRATARPGRSAMSAAREEILEPHPRRAGRRPGR